MSLTRSGDVTRFSTARTTPSFDLTPIAVVPSYRRNAKSDQHTRAHISTARHDCDVLSAGRLTSTRPPKVQ